ncbi:hypothetical protein Efla_007206 [Eimeria flavescens]
MSQQPCLHRGIIKTLFPSTPTPNLWASPVFFVSKKNGELRLVMDYSGRNSQTQPDKFPLTLIEVLFGKMSKSKEFSRLDLRNGFYPIRMADGDIFKTSSSSPQLQENAFHLNRSKRSFDADCIEFLGFQASPAGVQPLAANVSSFLSMPSTFSSGTARFCIRTDHKALLALLSKSSTQLQDRRARWMDLCMQSPFNIEHMSGKDNVVADLLGRLPEEAETSLTIACARLSQGPAETHSTAAYALALTAPETHARDALMSDIRRYRAGDPLYKKKDSRFSAPQVQDKFSLREKNVYFCKTRLYIPKLPVLRTHLIAEHHDSCYAGNLGRDRTTEFLSRGFYWPSLSQEVEAYVKSCDIRMRNKVAHHPVAPPSSPITAPSRWHTVSPVLSTIPPYSRGQHLHFGLHGQAD